MNKIPFLSILHNMKPVDDAENFQLFPDDYDGIFYGSTYSVSPKYITEHLQNFKEINLIIGIKDDDYQSQMINKIHYAKGLKSILNLENLEFFNQLDVESQNKILNKKINIFSPQYVIHSKFFLLTNKEKTLYRLIIGSANLTNAALNTNIPQFEDIQVFDNNKELFDFYLDRFKSMKAYTFDFITESLRETLKEKKKISKKDLKKEIKDNNNIVVLSHNDNALESEINTKELEKLEKPLFVSFNDDEKNNMITSCISELNNSLDEKIQSEILPSDTIEQIKEFSNELEKKDNKDFELVYKLSKQLITQANKSSPLKIEKSVKTIEKTIRKIIVPSIESERVNHIERFHLKRLDNKVTTFENVEGSIINIKNNNIIAYSKYADKENISKGLKNIDNLIRGYEKYLNHYDDETGKKIFEIILYSFTSPFFSIIRKSTNNNITRQSLFMFMFIGGIGGSGKSSVLKFISRMMKDEHQVKDFIDYARISNHPTPSAKTTETKTNILEMLKENNVFPLLIDEIPPVFFENKNLGEEIIKQTSNIIDEISDDYPTLIGTTNFNNYSLEYSASRRSYYIKLDIPFKENLRSESSEYHDKIINNLTTDLFKDFCCRFHEHILNKDTKYFNEDKNGLIDFLYLSREIFKSYYELAEMPLPRYFSNYLINDYAKANKDKWLDLFNSEYSNKNIFSYHKSGIIYFTPSELNKNQKLHQERLADSYINALPNHLSQKDISSYKIKIYATPFFEWLGIKNPYKPFWKIL